MCWKKKVKTETNILQLIYHFRDVDGFIEIPAPEYGKDEVMAETMADLVDQMTETYGITGAEVMEELMMEWKECAR